MSNKTFIVGRNPNVTAGEVPVPINDPEKKVSGNHCRIIFDGTNYFIEDLISTNGTFVNGNRINSKTIINSQHQVQLGRTYPFYLNHPIIQRFVVDHANFSDVQFSSEPQSQVIQEKKILPSNQLYISNSVTKNLPSMVKNELAKMTATKQGEYIEEYNRQTKSKGVAYIFLIMIFGMHYGYLKMWGLQFIFWFTGFGFGIWWFVDLFRLPSLVNDYNKDKAIEVMRNLKATST